MYFEKCKTGKEIEDSTNKWKIYIMLMDWKN